MDVTQALKDTENSLRDFIAICLSRHFGDEWISKCGVSPDRIEKRTERKNIEGKRQETGVVEERLIYYADFYDLKTILKKHWSLEFSKVFGELKTMEVWLTEMEKLRDPDAHRRELLPHQKHLILGISGEIRTRLVKYRSKMETTDDFFPRIESARDSLGTISTYGQLISHTQHKLRPGDIIDFVITASDPLGEELQYGMTVLHNYNIMWQDDNTFTLVIEKEYIGKSFAVHLWIRSPRDYHAHGGYDDYVSFRYDVLPLK
jgi:hypothetical protein